MGIRFSCPNGHKLNVKTFLAGKRGVCPHCGARFDIPMPVDSRNSELPQPVAVGQSHSVEIISPTPRQATSAAASPSIIITVADIGASLRQVESDSAAIPAPESAWTAIPTASIAVTQPLVITEPVAGSPETAILTRRERSRRNQIAISVVLLVLVIVLAAVLIWVLGRDVSQTPVEKVSAGVHSQLRQDLTTATSG